VRHSRSLIATALLTAWAVAGAALSAVPSAGLVAPVDPSPPAGPTSPVGRSGAAGSTSTSPTVVAEDVELPGGGRVMFPGRRLVAMYGHPGTPSLGVLGEQGVEAAVTRARRLARPYRSLSAVPVVPAFELIATVAQRSAGSDGDFSGEATVAKLRPWVRAAARNGMYVVLDLQPGRAELLDQARRYRSLLLEPHVGLAVDPEWKLGPRQRPGGQIGSIGAAEINRTSAWLATLTRNNDLPQKLFVVHQFRLSMIRHPERLRTDRPEIAVLIHMDGQGSVAQKHATWDAVRRARPDKVPMGWKNFFDEDSHVFTPAQTMAKRPRPLMVSYQ
jgi:hypothetical protein